MKRQGKRPTICFAVPFFPKYFPGGAEVQTYFIARHMLEEGWEVHFTTQDCGQPTAKLENEDGIWVHKLKAIRLFNPLRCLELYRELTRIGADIYYQRGGTECTFVTSLVAKALNSRFVWATSFDVDSDGNKFKRGLRDEAVKGLKRRILWFDAWIRDTLVSFGRKKADVIVVQSESQRVRMKERLGHESTVIQTGHALPQRPVKKPSPPVVIWIANIKKHKRPELFIELAKECRDLTARFLLVGRCTRPRYLRHLRQLGRAVKNLEFVGAVPFAKTNELLDTATVLVNTSTREGFPNTFVQAWLRETPVVSLSLDPNGVLARESIGICSGDFYRMVEDVHRLVKSESLREEMAKRARAYAMREHNLADKLRQYTELFESLYDERRMVQST